VSAAGEAQAKEDALASGAEPRPEGRVRERGWRPTRGRSGVAESRTEAARRLAIARARHGTTDLSSGDMEGAA